MYSENLFFLNQDFAFDTEIDLLKGNSGFTYIKWLSKLTIYITCVYIYMLTCQCQVIQLCHNKKCKWGKDDLKWVLLILMFKAFRKMEKFLN